MEFTGQVAIVTGGSRGIGRAVVRELARRGARVLFCYRERAAAAAETQKIVADAGGVAEAMQADVSDPATGAALVGAALNRWGQLDILVNCAGRVGYGAIETMSSERWRESIATNLTGVYHTCRAALRPMMQRRYGRIVNLSALHANGGFPGQADYSAATAGVLGFTRSLAREAAAWSITVNAVAPGFVETEQLDVLPDEVRAWGEEIIAMRRAGRPEEVSSAVLFLASPMASYITGHTLAVDGGWRMSG
ncbi:SDR family oxidoreductase [Oscillochloris sp. ZM17-4]|uniref:SDR family oxidoreductase n=1 Tax=Oscillochloris sp. ZM17-4 TaxID=2866714 RepID=UPI001C72D3DC|nr:SDR family NAD(P)-dependent oxidoreductase [Oscillochloris sp. ZM17-4]MBX0326855.1 SDR family oxidoreductase [Oscillochloris sp. ZM17-4]